MGTLVAVAEASPVLQASAGLVELRRELADPAARQVSVVDVGSGSLTR